ncbi:MAG: hypothetical protein DDT23_00739 [candidate division WS2 bacterium]|nr:hypothetical protein [Candidatus Lithacetigena glycinireducens]
MQKIKTSTLLRYLVILVIALFVLVGIIGIIGKTSIGMFVWTYTKIAPLATLVSPKDAVLRFEIGNYYFGGGAYDIEKAEKYYLEALKIDPALHGPHYQLARIYFVQGRFYLAMQEINKEIEMYPEFKRSYYVRGLIYGYSGRLEEAADDFKEFLKWKPDSWAGKNDLAWIYFQQGKYTETGDAARAGLKVAPDNPWLLNALGVSLLNTGDKKGAKEAFIKALEIVATMSPKDWGRAYPGNDPSIYREGLTKMKESIEENLKLLGDDGAIKSGT